MDDRTEMRLEDNGDEKVTNLLRAFYAPPAEGAYWNALEQRVMRHIAEHRAGTSLIPVNWWSDLAGWAAPGLAAAALIVAAASAIWSRENEEEMRSTYEAVSEPPAPDALPGAVQVVVAPRDGSSQREATFRYVLSH
jgi:hypothetical protein